jgi:hypothetical protein
LGRRFWLAEGASQKPLDGLRTRGSQGPDESGVVVVIWNTNAVLSRQFAK